MSGIHTLVLEAVIRESDRKLRAFRTQCSLDVNAENVSVTYQVFRRRRLSQQARIDRLHVGFGKPIQDLHFVLDRANMWAVNGGATGQPNQEYGTSKRAHKRPGKQPALSWTRPRVPQPGTRSLVHDAVHGE